MFGDKQFVWEEFLFGYDWFIRQMKVRIGKIPFPECDPIWAWYQYSGSKNRRPDLRNSALLKRGEKGVCIQIEKKDSEVLLSDFHLWSYPLSFKMYLGNFEQDSLDFDKFFEKRNLDSLNFDTFPLEIKHKIVKSWDKIFDLYFDDPYHAHKRSDKSIQATFWSLSINEITKVDYFTAR